MHKNQVEADRRYRAKQAEAGNVRVTVLVPAARRAEIRRLAEKMRAEPAGEPSIEELRLLSAEATIRLLRRAARSQKATIEELRARVAELEDPKKQPNRRR